jgi:hypothetical protein
MLSLEKTRAARYANRSPLYWFGFVSAADPINCVAENCAVADFLAAALTEKAAEAEVEGRRFDMVAGQAAAGG